MKLLAPSISGTQRCVWSLGTQNGRFAGCLKLHVGCLPIAWNSNCSLGSGDDNAPDRWKPKIACKAAQGSYCWLPGAYYPIGFLALARFSKQNAKNDAETQSITMPKNHWKNRHLRNCWPGGNGGERPIAQNPTLQVRFVPEIPGPILPKKWWKRWDAIRCG